MAADALSPRAWGWSAERGAHGKAKIVVPTRVGMVRVDGRAHHRETRCPHARGDGPVICTADGEGVALSPRAWGWSDSFMETLDRAVVVPTRVGMVRAAAGQKVESGSCPHARGDGPSCSPANVTDSSLSPRAWGWSVYPTRVPLWACVVPTRVGMVRLVTLITQPEQRCPHARGDGPLVVEASTPNTALSPRAWGWSALVFLWAWGSLVVPTRVGMVRLSMHSLLSGRGCPHARGDGP